MTTPKESTESQWNASRTMRIVISVDEQGSTFGMSKEGCTPVIVSLKTTDLNKIFQAISNTLSNADRTWEQSNVDQQPPSVTLIIKPVPINVHWKRLWDRLLATPPAELEMEQKMLNWLATSIPCLADVRAIEERIIDLLRD